jgi:hypothetical protein
MGKQRRSEKMERSRAGAKLRPDHKDLIYILEEMPEGTGIVIAHPRTACQGPGSCTTNVFLSRRKRRQGQHRDIHIRHQEDGALLIWRGDYDEAMASRAAARWAQENNGKE